MHEILKSYWGYSEFRPLQEEIIQSALDDYDSLALLPTGGGKSICYQVPALVQDGLCLVVSPLIALMKDQVNDLRKKGIKASALISGMRNSEVDAILDNCIYSDIKFLYLSPERLKSDLVQDRLKQMKLNLIAIDEAHCISQWGYDFRPSYLELKEIRKLLPDTPILALTATATPEVVIDIQKQLAFEKERVFKASFLRSNLAYMVFEEEDKLNKLKLMLTKNQGSAIVYMRSRKACESLSAQIQKMGFSCTYYHAGLNMEIRQKRQEMWSRSEKRVIVATNAFGMGIDKPDVRLVVHLDIPESPEAYFQEAGRAGRDGNKSFSVLLYDKADIDKLKDRFLQQFPPIKEVKRAYSGLANYLQLAVGSALDQEYDFDLNEFASRFNLNAYNLTQCFKILELAGLLQFEQDSFLASRVQIVCNKSDLYHYELEHERESKVIKTLMRSNIGVLDSYVKINEAQIAKRLDEKVEYVRKVLEQLDQLGICSYLPHSSKPKVTYLRERQAEDKIGIPKEAYRFRKETMKKKLMAMVDFVKSDSICRTRFLLDYFGEKDASDCKVCDVCLAKAKQNESPKVLKQKLKDFLVEEKSLNQLELLLDDQRTKLLDTLREMIDEGEVQFESDKYLLNISAKN